MMRQEFIDRTGYTPTQEEYYYIEQSYYEADTPYKDVFCKQWLKDKKSGKWEMELKFRKALDVQKTKYEKQLAEQQDTLNFYRNEFEGYLKLKSQVRAITEIINNRDYTYIHKK